MPQGRRKVPFSAKQKKAQLQTKREQKKVTRPAHPTIHRKPLVSDDGDIEDLSVSVFKFPQKLLFS